MAILGIVATVAVRLASFPSERKITSLESENIQLHNKLEEIIESQARLTETLTLIKTASSEKQSLKSEIDQELKHLAQMVGVNSASVLIPYPPGENTSFAFLSISGPEAHRLKNTLFDINKGVAGQVYASQNPRIVTSAKTDENWEDKVDKRIEFKTKNLLCVPIIFAGQIVGVAQFLNKPDNFAKRDMEIVIDAMTTLAYKVGKFVKKVDNFEILGLGSSYDKRGTVIYSDLSASSSLLKGPHPERTIDVINIINEYLERLADIALRNNCIVDKYMWDGSLYSLNIAKTVPEHRLVAYHTALAMNSEFEKLKSSWLRAGFSVEPLFSRVAITGGPIVQVDMGPAQYRQKTIVGDPVVAAAHLCANAPRHKNVIVVDETVYTAIKSENIRVTRMPHSNMGKAEGLISNAYFVEQKTI